MGMVLALRQRVGFYRTVARLSHGLNYSSRTSSILTTLISTLQTRSPSSSSVEQMSSDRQRAGGSLSRPESMASRLCSPSSNHFRHRSHPASPDRYADRDERLRHDHFAGTNTPAHYPICYRAKKLPLTRHDHNHAFPRACTMMTTS